MEEGAIAMNNNDVECYSDDDCSFDLDEEGIVVDVSDSELGDLKDSEFKVLEIESAVSLMRKNLKDVAEVVELPETICRLLLRAFGWNKERLVETYYEAGDAISCFAEKVDISSLKATCGPRKVAVVKGSCGICFESALVTTFLCGHKYCSTCWNGYLTNEVMEEGCTHFKCPGISCTVVIDDELALSLIGSAECNRSLRWCPAPDCGRVLMLQQPAAVPVKCTCGLLCCFLCGHDWHEPMTCVLLKQWTKTCSDDSKTSNWILENTKDCPKCQAPIEKNGGCNHMICRNGNCRYEFCWMCLQKWPHVYGNNPYSCSTFEAKLPVKGDAVTQQRATLQRYLFYYDRFMNHQRSLKLEQKLYAKTNEKMVRLLKTAGMSQMELQFLHKAVDVLLVCRRTLMYSYAFAFYLQKNNQAEIFQENQRDMEHAVEDLSGLLERDLEVDDFLILKQKVQDKYCYVERRRTILVKHCVEGEERGFWSFPSTSSSSSGIRV